MQNLNKRNAATGNVKEIIIYTENVFLLLENGFGVRPRTLPCVAADGLLTGV